MRTFVCVLDVSILSLWILATDLVQKELKLLDGIWVAMREDGSEEGYTIVFSGARFEQKQANKIVATAAVKLDPTKDPKHIDLIVENGPYKGATLFGIYQVDGDNLKLSFALRSKDRPKRYEDETPLKLALKRKKAGAT